MFAKFIDKSEKQTVPTNQPGRTNPAKTLVLALVSSLSALLLLTSQASAQSFSFSTGNPDGKIATLSRPSSAGKIQTETADDFILAQTTFINRATITGLLPTGAPLTSISDVEIEVYRVFPADSDASRTLTVPTRTNSPSDNEIDDATRDGGDGSLSFAATVLNASFSVENSVVNGINRNRIARVHGRLPGHPDVGLRVGVRGGGRRSHDRPRCGPRTRPERPRPGGDRSGGEGAVTGEEVSISVTFNTPISLPAGHYFFRPEVQLSSGDFLWLSAPKPTSPPLFVGDLQSWIRNDNLAPDWLRIGTDITHQGPFNATFSLAGVSIEGLVPCSGPLSGGTWRNHGQYVSAVAHVVNGFLEEGLITEEQAEAIVASAAESNCGAKK